VGFLGDVFDSRNHRTSDKDVMQTEQNHLPPNETDFDDTSGDETDFYLSCLDLSFDESDSSEARAKRRRFEKEKKEMKEGRWPPSLVKACVDNFFYACQLNTGAVVEFSSGTVLNRDWVLFSGFDGVSVGGFDVPPPFPRGMDVRIADVVWYQDAVGVLQLSTGTIIRYSERRQTNPEWIHLDVKEGCGVIFPSEGLGGSAPILPDLVVKVANIVWIADAPYGS
jgi:hypothetical protein